MKSLLLETLIKPLVPLFIIFAVYMLFRGHNNPGGGFIAGLISVLPLMIHAIAFSPQKTVAIYKVKPLFMASGGLLLATISGMFAILKEKPFLTPLWPDSSMPLIGKVGTPILFDLGVFFVVAGVILKVTFIFTQNIEK